MTKATKPIKPFVAEMLDDYIESVTDDREPDGKYHPSSMFVCDRKAIYEVRGTEPSEKPDLKAKRRFYIGHRLHESLQRTMESHPGVTTFYPEFEIDVPDYNLYGHGDGLVLYEGEWWLLEVKSIKKAGVRMGLPKEMHVQQAIAYWWAVTHFGFKVDPMPGVTLDSGEKMVMPPLGETLKGILMVYVEKEDLNVYEYVIEANPDEWNAMMQDKIATLDLYRDDPEALPPRLPRDPKTGRKHWMCGYCPFATKCWNEDPAEVTLTMEDF
jgi:hypothetical protein